MSNEWSIRREDERDEMDERDEKDEMRRTDTDTEIGCVWSWSRFRSCLCAFSNKFTLAGSLRTVLSCVYRCVSFKVMFV